MSGPIRRRRTGFDASADGSRFVILRTGGNRSRPPSVTVIQNGFTEFKDGKQGERGGWARPRAAPVQPFAAVVRPGRREA